MSLKKLAGVVCCIAALAATVAEAKKLVLKNVPLEAFPGVDADAQLDGGTNLGLVKATVNLKNGLATVSARANVPNLAFQKVTFINVDLGLLGGVLISDRYVVAKNGRATYSAKYADVTL